MECETVHLLPARVTAEESTVGGGSFPKLLLARLITHVPDRSVPRVCWAKRGRANGSRARIRRSVARIRIECGGRVDDLEPTTSALLRDLKDRLDLYEGRERDGAPTPLRDKDPILDCINRLSRHQANVASPASVKPRRPRIRSPWLAPVGLSGSTRSTRPRPAGETCRPCLALGGTASANHCGRTQTRTADM